MRTVPLTFATRSISFVVTQIFAYENLQTHSFAFELFLASSDAIISIIFQARIANSTWHRARGRNYRNSSSFRFSRRGCSRPVINICAVSGIPSPSLGCLMLTIGKHLNGSKLIWIWMEVCHKKWSGTVWFITDNLNNCVEVWSFRWRASRDAVFMFYNQLIYQLE